MTVSHALVGLHASKVTSHQCSFLFPRGFLSSKKNAVIYRALLTSTSPREVTWGFGHTVLPNDRGKDR